MSSGPDNLVPFRGVDHFRVGTGHDFETNEPIVLLRIVWSDATEDAIALDPGTAAAMAEDLCHATRAVIERH